MGSSTIPINLSLAESGAAALAEAAEDLRAADDTPKFLAALDNTHRLWLALADIARRNGWNVPDARTAEFVVTTARSAGKGVRDEHVETLIGINRDVSRRLARGRDLDSIRRRAQLAWQEKGRPLGLSLERWLISEIERKARIN